MQLSVELCNVRVRAPQQQQQGKMTRMVYDMTVWLVRCDHRRPHCKMMGQHIETNNIRENKYIEPRISVSILYGVLNASINTLAKSKTIAS